jgi:hypothetical protein
LISWPSDKIKRWNATIAYAGERAENHRSLLLISLSSISNTTIYTSSKRAGGFCQVLSVAVAPPEPREIPGNLSWSNSQEQNKTNDRVQKI